MSRCGKEKQVIHWHRYDNMGTLVKVTPIRQYVHTRELDGTQFAISLRTKIPVTRQGDEYHAPEEFNPPVHLMLPPIVVGTTLREGWRVACAPRRHYTDFIRSTNRTDVTCANCLRRKV